MDAIRLEGMLFYGRHGVGEWERMQGQPFRIDLTLYLSLEPAARSDALEDTVDYARVFSLVRERVEGEPVALLERLAGRILQDVFSAFPPVREAEVVVHKPQAPLGGHFEDVAVHLRRGRP